MRRKNPGGAVRQANMGEQRGAESVTIRDPKSQPAHCGGPRYRNGRKARPQRYAPSAQDQESGDRTAGRPPLQTAIAALKEHDRRKFKSILEFNGDDGKADSRMPHAAHTTIIASPHSATAPDPLRAGIGVDGTDVTDRRSAGDLHRNPPPVQRIAGAPLNRAANWHGFALLLFHGAPQYDSPEPGRKRPACIGVANREGLPLAGGARQVQPPDAPVIAG